MNCMLCGWAADSRSIGSHCNLLLLQHSAVEDPREMAKYDLY